MRNNILKNCSNCCTKSSDKGHLRHRSGILAKLLIFVLCFAMLGLVSCTVKPSETPPIDNTIKDEDVVKDPTLAQGNPGATQVVSSLDGNGNVSVTIGANSIGYLTSNAGTINRSSDWLDVKGADNTNNVLFYANVRMDGVVLALARNGHLAVSASAKISNNHIGGFPTSYVGIAPYKDTLAADTSLSNADNAYQNNTINVATSYTDNVDKVGYIRNRYNFPSESHTIDVNVPGRVGNDAAGAGFSRDNVIGATGSPHTGGYNYSGDAKYYEGQTSQKYFGAGTDATIRVYVLISDNDLNLGIGNIKVNFSTSYAYKEYSMAGDGSVGNPIQIKNGADLRYVSSRSALDASWLSKSYKVMNKIDMTNVSYVTPIGFNNPFSGILDGNNQLIQNFKQESTTRDKFSYFGLIGNNTGTIKNVILQSARISYFATGIAGQIGSISGRNAGTIQKCLIFDSSTQNGDASASNPIYGAIIGSSSGRVTDTYFVTTNGADNSGATDKATKGYLLNTEASNGNNTYTFKTTNQFIFLSYMVNNGIRPEGIAAPYNYAAAGKIFSLNADLNLSGQGFIPIGTTSQPFKSHFNFNNRTLTTVMDNLNGLDDNYVGGIFGYVTTAVTIKDLTINGTISLNNPSATTKYGGFIGQADNGVTITNITSNVNISKMNGIVGGIVGYNNGTVSNCKYFGKGISGLGSSATVGGIVGVNGGTVSNSRTIETDFSSGGNIKGGIVGTNNGSINNSYVSAILGTATTFGYIIGSGNGNVDNCFALATKAQDDVRASWNTIGEKIILSDISHNAATEFGFNSNNKFFVKITTIADGKFVKWTKGSTQIDDNRQYTIGTYENNVSIVASIHDFVIDGIKLKDVTYGDTATSIVRLDNGTEGIYNNNRLTTSIANIVGAVAGSHDIVVTFDPEGDYNTFTRTLALQVAKANFTFTIGNGTSQMQFDYGIANFTLQMLSNTSNSTMGNPYTLSFVRTTADGREIEDMIVSGVYNAATKSYIISLINSTYDLKNNTDAKITINASIAESQNYNAASASATLSINRIGQTLTFGDGNGAVNNDEMIYTYQQGKVFNLLSTTANASMTNDLSLSYSRGGSAFNDIATILNISNKIMANGSVLTNISANILNSTFVKGTDNFVDSPIQIIANVAPSQNYFAASKNITLKISRINQNITFGDINQTYTKNKTVTLNATTDADATVVPKFVYVSSHTDLVSIDANIAKILMSTFGYDCKITASLPDYQNYNSATKTVNFAVARAQLAITSGKGKGNYTYNEIVNDPYALTTAYLGLATNGDDSAPIDYKFNYAPNDAFSPTVFTIIDKNGRYSIKLLNSSFGGTSKFVISLAANHNYTEASLDFPIEVSRTIVYISALEGQNKIYDGKEVNDIKYYANINSSTSSGNALVGAVDNGYAESGKLDKIFTGSLSLGNDTINANTYTISKGTLASRNYNISSIKGNYTIQKRQIEIAASSLNSITRQYDSTCLITKDLMDQVFKDYEFLIGNANEGIIEKDNNKEALNINYQNGTISTKGVGDNKSISFVTAVDSNVIPLSLKGTAANNYILKSVPSPKVNITKATLNTIGIAAREKTYNGKSNDIEIILMGETGLSGAFYGDNVILNNRPSPGNSQNMYLGHGSVSSPNVGLNKAVTLNSSSITLGGIDAANYDLVLPSEVKVDIVQNRIKILGVTAVDREYNGKLDVVINGGTLGIGFSNVEIPSEDLRNMGFRFSDFGKIQDPNANSQFKEVTYRVELFDKTSGSGVAQNYIVDQMGTVLVKINKKQLVVNNPTFSTQNKIYDGKMDYLGKITVGNITDAFAAEEFARLNYAINAIAEYAQSAVGTNLKVAVTYMLDMNSSSNYLAPLRYEQNGFNIDPKQLKVTLFNMSKYTKVYDGDATYQVGIGGDGYQITTPVLDGVITSNGMRDDIYILNYTLRFNSKDVVNANKLIASFVTGGSQSGNYTLAEYIFGTDVGCDVKKAVSISQYSLTITYDTETLNQVYKANEVKVVKGTANTINNEVATLAFTYSQNGILVQPIARGEYLIIPTVSDNQNYKIADGSLNQKLRITLAIVGGIQFNNQEYTYNRIVPTVVATGFDLNLATVAYKYYKMVDGSKQEIALAEIIDAGSYIVEAIFTLNDEVNYERIPNREVAVTVNPKGVNLVLSGNIDLVYSIDMYGNPMAKTVGVSIKSGDVLDADSVILAILNNSNIATNAGTYNINAKLHLDDMQDAPNYKIVNNNVEFVIHKARVDNELLRFTSSELVYDGEYHTLKLDNEARLPKEITVSYIYAPNGTNLGVRNVAVYDVIAIFKIQDHGVGGNHIYNYEAIANQNAKLSIKPKDITVTLTGVDKLTYSGNKQAISFNVSGTIGSEDINLVRLVGADNIINAGKYSIGIELVGENKGNYSVVGNKTVEIDVKKATWSNVGIDKKEVVFDGNVHSLELNNLLPKDGQITATFNHNSYTNVGQYQITVRFTIQSFDGRTNYEPMKDSTAELNIKPFIITEYTYSDYSGLVYNGTEQTIGVRFYNEKHEVKVGNILFNTNKVSIRNADTYSAKLVIYKEGGVMVDNNYSLYEVESQSVTIEKATIVATFEGSEIGRTYNGSIQTILALENDALTANAELVLNYKNNAQKNKGEYVISLEIKPKSGSETNYNVFEPINATYSIEAAGIELNYTDNTNLMYNGETHAIGANIASGLLVGDSVTLVLSNNELLNAGVYGVTTTLNGADASNYYIINQECEVTVAKAILTGYVLENKQVEYNGEVHTLTLNKALPTDGQVSVEIINGNRTNVSYIDNNVVTVVVNAVFTIKPIDEEGIIFNYEEIETLSGNLLITPKKVDISYSAYSGLEYNGTAQTINATYQNIGSKTVEANLTYSSMPINAGNYSAYPQIEDRNYIPNDEHARFAFKISKKQLTTSVDREDRYFYNGKTQTIKVFLLGVLDEDRDKVKAVLTYSTSGEGMLSAGTYNILVGVNDKNYEVVQDEYNVTVIVEKLTLKIGVENMVVKFGQEINFIYTYSGFVQGEGETNLLKLPQISMSNRDIGYYEVTPYGAASQNYALSYLPGLLTINADKVEDEENDDAKLEGSFAPELELKVTKSENHINIPKNYSLACQYMFELFKNGEIVSLADSQTITIRIKLDKKQMNKDDYKVVYVGVDGNLVYMRNVKYENGYITFQTNKLETFAVLTSTNYTFIYVLVGIGIIFLVGGMFVLLFKRKY